MDAHPLFEAFLAELAKAGMPVLARDYRRLRLALAAEHSWDQASLREVLTVLLGRDPEQQQRCAQIFDSYYPRFQQEPESLGRFVPGFTSAAAADVEQSSTRSWWVLLHPVLFLLSLWLIWPRGIPLSVPPGTPSKVDVVFEPFDVFNELRSGDGRVKSTEIVSHSDQPQTLDLVILPANSGFRLVDADAILYLAPHETVKLSIVYDAPTDFVGSAHAQLIAFPPEPEAAMVLDLCAQVNPRPQLQLREANFPVIESTSTAEASSIDITVSDLPFKTIWKYLLWASLVLALALLAFLAYLRRWQRLPQDPPAEFDANNPKRYFSMGSVAGPPPPFLSAADLDAIAVVVGSYRSQEASSTLDTPGSIKASLARGLAVLRFQRAKRPRTLLVLEDQGCEAAFRLPVAEELVAGLQKRGCSALFGRCSPSQGKIWDKRGRALELEALAAEPRALTVLVFGDGACFKHGSRFNASCWPRLAWLDVREPRLRLSLAHDPRLPVFSANGPGILACLRAFHHEGWSGASPKPVAEDPSCASVGIAEPMAIETLLGEALIWAADCAVLQPCSLGLAHALRRQHHPYLEAWSIQRLIRLAGTSLGPEGLRFSKENRAFLHKFWRIRRDEPSQNAVLQSILAGLELAQPEDPQSLAYMSWEILRERLRLDMEHQADHHRLAELAGSRLGPALRAQLEDVQIVEDDESVAPGKIPIRVDNRHARQRLACISADLGLVHLDRYPLKPWHKILQVILALSLLLILSFTVQLWSWEQQQPRWLLSGLKTGEQLELVALDGTSQVAWSKDGGSRSPLTGSFQIKWHHGEQTLTRTVHRLRHQQIAMAMVREGKAKVNLVPIAAGSFLMGSGPDEPNRGSDETQHQVTLTQDYYLGATEVTQGFWRDVMGALPQEHYVAGESYPVGGVSWEDSKAFCDKLTEREQSAGRLPSGWRYTLPTEAQWEYAARAGAKTSYPFGEDATLLGYYAWYGLNSRMKQHEVGGKRPNAWGLYDMLGSLWEWCADWRADYPLKSSSDPEGPVEGDKRVFRGGVWYLLDENCRPAYRDAGPPAYRGQDIGFRVALVQVEALSEGRGQQLELVWLEPGTFLMGSPEGAPGRQKDETQHEARLTQAFAMGRFEVSQALYQQVMGTNPSYFKGEQLPVDSVTWEEAKNFCAVLSELEKDHLPKGYHYDLPTEAEWEYTARAGSATLYPFGNDAADLRKYAWYDQPKSQPIGRLTHNPWGLYDMLGNQWEWCGDWYGTYPRQAAIDPVGPGVGDERVLRGGGWYSGAQGCRSAQRNVAHPAGRNQLIGFRVALVQ